MSPARPVTLATPLGPPHQWVERHGLPVGGALLDADGGPDPRGRFACLALEPETVLRWSPDAGGDPFAALAAFETAAGRMPAPPDDPAPWPRIVLCAAYDLGRTIERLPVVARFEGHVPDLWAACYPAVYVYDHRLKQGAIRAVSSAAAHTLRRRLENGDPVTPPPAPVGRPQAEMTREAYDRAFQRVQAHIRAGDTYQINLTVRFRAERGRGGDPVGFYPHLRRASPAPFGACVRMGKETAVFSISPERFLRWSADGAVETSPIKGTRPRGTTAAEDAAQRAALAGSEKDHAEHVMILDLQRNDLGRVCEIGSVSVVAPPHLETHPTVHHLVSTVRGRLRPEVDVATLLRATFPGGSITGAPKIRSMEIIEALEPTRRGPYCGSIGYLDARGGGDLNIAIRTAWTTAEAVYYQAGGGLVEASEADDEWAELHTKARAFFTACATAGPPGA
jgi:para-aminobenzoate synthetase component 1